MRIPQEPSCVDRNIEYLCDSTDKHGVVLSLYRILLAHYQLISCGEKLYSYTPAPGIDPIK